MWEMDMDCSMDGCDRRTGITGMQHTEGFFAGPHLGADTCVDPVFLGEAMETTETEQGMTGGQWVAWRLRDSA